MVVKRLIRQTVYPRPHALENKFNMNSYDANKRATIYPLIMQDEGLGDPGSYNANPLHASFATTGEVNCYPDSRVNTIFCEMEMSLTKAARLTDSIEELRVMIVPLYFAFKEVAETVDDITGHTLLASLEMQKEATDRQMYPLFNGTDLSGPSKSIGANMPGLTTDQTIEGVAFDAEDFYNKLQWSTFSKRMSSSIGKIQWVSVRKDRAVRRRFKLTPRVKRMNPYTFMGVLIYVPDTAFRWQVGSTGDTTNIDHLNVAMKTRYNEWNDNFDHTRV